MQYTAVEPPKNSAAILGKIAAFLTRDIAMPASVDTHYAAQPFLDQPWQFFDALPPIAAARRTVCAGIHRRDSETAAGAGSLAYGDPVQRIRTVDDIMNRVLRR
jgi:hypothetical protein